MDHYERARQPFGSFLFSRGLLAGRSCRASRRHESRSPYKSSIRMVDIGGFLGVTMGGWGAVGAGRFLQGDVISLRQDARGPCLRAKRSGGGGLTRRDWCWTNVGRPHVCHIDAMARGGPVRRFAGLDGIHLDGGCAVDSCYLQGLRPARHGQRSPDVESAEI